MKLLASIWSFFNGKKTNIAAIAGSASMALTAAVDAGVLDPNTPIVEKAVKVLAYASGGFGIPGLAHKWMKAK